MMNVTERTPQVKQVAEELTNILNLFKMEKNNSEITTSSGRTYRVANVRENKKEGSWDVTEGVSRGMFSCEMCGEPFSPKMFLEDDWTQITHGDDVVRVHSSQVHEFKKHPENVPQESVEKVASVVLS